jgi:hypothetical protein
MVGKKPRSNATTLIAIVFIGGGIIGVITGLWSEWQTVLRAGITPTWQGLILSVFTLVFALTVWLGIELWGGNRRAYKWAKLVFILQIPKFTFAGIGYYFYTALALFFSVEVDSAARANFNFQFGSEIRFLIWPGHFVMGANLAAIALFIALVKTDPDKQSREAPPGKPGFGLIG